MRFVLMCQVLDGEPPIHIKWFKDKQELLGPSGRALDEQVELMANDELGSSSLLFRRVQQQHGGNYTCLATNHLGSSAYSSSMSVKGECALVTVTVTFCSIGSRSHSHLSERQP